MRSITVSSVARLGAVLTIVTTVSLAGMATFQPALAAPDAPVKFMQRVSKELLAAHRALSEGQMTRVIRSRGDVAAMGRFSLGTYYARLKQNSRRSYFNGMTRFMARYIVSQSRTYKVARTQILRPSSRRGRDYVVNSKVILVDGTVYDVQWLLAKRGNTFKVRDINVLGFWVMPFQRNLFRSYVRKANGNVNALVLALNQ